MLLKNDGGVLPFTKGKKTAVLGPHVHSTRDLMSDYKGDEQVTLPIVSSSGHQPMLPPADWCPPPQHTHICVLNNATQCNGGGKDFSCFPTIAEAMTAYNGPASTTVAQGVDMAKTDPESNDIPVS